MSDRSRCLQMWPPPRGMALLVVLSVLVLTLPLAAAAVRRATLSHLERSLDTSQRQADDLIHAATAPILHWLRHEADNVVLPPDLQFQRFPFFMMRGRMTAGRPFA